jgi:prevent-host-death family protein
MTLVNIHEAKTQLSRLLARVVEGEEIVIAKSGNPIARLVAVERRTRHRVFGQDRGLFEVPDDFDDPLPEDVLASFER